MMKTITSNKQFNDLVHGDKPFIIDFYADWCGPCQTLLPTVEKLSIEYCDKVEVVKANIDQQQALAQKFGVRSIPTLFFMKGNKVLDSINGLVSEHTLRQKIEALA